MEEQSGISGAATNVKREVFEPNCISHAIQNKRQKLNGNVSSFRGVVVQQNGEWGGQICPDYHQIWLGTLKSEREAAVACDNAANYLRSVDSHRNFPWMRVKIEKPNFQSQSSAETVLNMNKDGSYNYLRPQSHAGYESVTVSGNGGIFCKRLFKKELTPSDVGKLNRIVIPKKSAVMYFPRISDDVKKNGDGGRVNDTELVFFDGKMRSWKFRYCYWKSSQSFVFTRGWNRFVKEKGLRAKDVVIFSLCEGKDVLNESQSLFKIDVEYYHQATGFHCDLVANAFVEQKDCVKKESIGLRLFGVQII